jgi:serine kinase of HPr protein (carbohydrate metabolism regulator)
MMKVKDIIEKLNLKLLNQNVDLNKEISGVYSCDLLSWVMSHGSKNNIWITVQVHPNVIAVAQLLEFLCIIIPENIEVEKLTLDKAEQESIPILQSEDNAYALCSKLSDLGL